MSKINNCWFVVISLSLILIFSSCANRSKKEFNRLLVELVGNDATVDVNDWGKLRSFIEDNRTSLPSNFYDGDKMNLEAIKTYITDFFKNRRPPITVTFYGMTNGSQFLTIKFYLERSGSTYGYDTPQCNGDFKAAIVSILNNLPGNNKDNTDFIVNNGVYKYPKSYRDFIVDPNIFESTKGIGNPRYTDFQKIFNTLLDNTKDNEISILVTDLIYSVKEMTGVSPSKVFNEEQGMANAAFTGHTKNKSIIILQMTSDYYGEYYTYNSINRGLPYSGKRPYYFLIVGNNSDIQRIATDVQYQNFMDFNKMNGFLHKYCMSVSGAFNPYYTLALENKDNEGKFREDRDADEGVCAIKDIKPDRNSGRFRFVLAVNLNSILADKEYLTNAANYQIDSEDKASIEAIKEITPADITQNNREALSKASHLIVINMNKFTHNQVMHIRLMNKLPDWVEQSSSDNDTNVRSYDFAHTTFGLKYLMKGIYDAYSNTSNGNLHYFDIAVELNK